MYKQSKSFVKPPVEPPTRSVLRIVIIVLLIVIVALLLLISLRGGSGPATNDQAQTQEPAFDKTQFSLSDPTSPWVVVNKKRPLNPSTYTPADLVAPDMALRGAKTAENMQLTPETATALAALAQAAGAEGIELVVVSAFRPYETQKSIYESEVRGFGQEQADRESARPGHSEHQTGLAVDLGAASKKCEIEACFGEMAEGKWLAANAYKYGFILRYVEGKESVTGYNYEPWHLRYVGADLAGEMHRTGIKTLEEFFDLPAAPTY
jgi:D-alanyl-D-alanine carboxypeptidase